MKSKSECEKSGKISTSLSISKVSNRSRCRSNNKSESESESDSDDRPRSLQPCYSQGTFCDGWKVLKDLPSEKRLTFFFSLPSKQNRWKSNRLQSIGFARISTEERDLTTCTSNPSTNPEFPSIPFPRKRKKKAGASPTEDPLALSNRHKMSPD